MTKDQQDPLKMAQRLAKTASSLQDQLSLDEPEPAGGNLTVTTDTPQGGTVVRNRTHKQQLALLMELMGDQTSMPSTPPDTTIIPSEMVRCSLFNARRGSAKREYLKDAKLTSIGNQKLLYTGEDLRQADCDVYLKIIELAARANPVINIHEDMVAHVTFSYYALVKALGIRSFSQASVKRVKESIKRLDAGIVDIQCERLSSLSSARSNPTFRFHLLNIEIMDEANANGPGHTVTCSLPLHLVFLLQGGNHYTRIYWLQRSSLKSNVAKWLMSYFSSHKKPFPITLDSVIQGAGLTTKRRADARVTVQKALDELLFSGFLIKASLENDIITVERAPLTLTANAKNQ